MTPSAYIFDVEGTLVDSVPLTLRCWQETLRGAGKEIPLDRLQQLSGMDGADLLETLVPELSKRKRKTLLAAQGARFEAHELHKVRAFPRVRATLSVLKSNGAQLALATDCKGATLHHYRVLLGIDDLLDAVACGEDVPEGKPNPDLITRALRALKQGPEHCIMVGDTPFDAAAAARAGVACIGVMTGGFGAGELLAAGCERVEGRVSDLAALAPAPGS